MLHLLVLANLGSLVSPASASERLTPIYPEATERRAVRASPSRLPRGVTGAPPQMDGGQFAAIVEPDIYPVRSTEDVTAALDEILPALGIEIDAKELVVSVEGEDKPMVDLDALYAEGEIATDEWLERTERSVGPLSKSTVEAMTEEAKEAADAATTPVRIWRFDQYIDRGRAVSRSIVVEVDDTGVRRIVGAVYGDTRTANEVAIDAERAEALAIRYTGDERATVTDGPELVVIPDGSDLLFAWRMTVETDDDPWAIDVDASTGRILQVDPQFWSFEEGQGRVAVPAIPATFDVFGFGVDAAAGSCNYTLNHTGVLTIENLAADNFSGTVKACKNAGGTVDFDVSPINDTTNVMDATAGNYNPKFAHVNAYAWVYEALDWYVSRGSGSLPAWKVVVGDPNPCNHGIDNACGKAGRVAFGIGSRTLGGASGFVNTALDASVAMHEVGHGINNLQYTAGGGTQNGSCAEGLSDYWAMSRLNQSAVGIIATQSTNGLRQSDSGDTFPEHVQNQNEVHANGEVISRALWLARAEMDGRSPVGPMFNDTTLMAALPAAGSGQSGDQTELAVHNAFQGILLSMIVQSGYTYATGDLLVGFAQAGLFTTDKESVVDISRDLLDEDETTPPSFTVWTGRDYAFSGDTATAATPYNTNYEIEVASDENFTQNVVSSGTLTNLSLVTNVPTGSWTLSDADWKTLRQGDAVYYRATTWTPGDLDSVRTSTHTYAEFIDVKPGRALVNHSNMGSACSSAGGGTIGGMGALLAVVGLVRRRRG